MHANKNLTRKEKLQLLQAIKDGRLSAECLQPARVYFFYERCENPGIYNMDGKDYTEEEYNEFCKRITEKNDRSIIWNEMRQYIDKDKIICMVNAKGCEPLGDQSVR